MKTFGNNDVVMARATIMGQELMNAKFNDITSMQTLLRLIKQQLGTVFGLVTISIRNLTQGWTQSQTYRLSSLAR